MSATAPPRTRTAKVLVVGASGMLTGELLRLMQEHPGVELMGAVSREPGRALGDLHAHLAGVESTLTVDLSSATTMLRQALEESEETPLAVVLGLPHGAAASAWAELRTELGDAADRVLVVDLSADYRLKDADVYAKWYGAEHADTEELNRFAYGLPELNRANLQRATRVAAPGCFATALQLATVPAARAGWLDAETPWHYSAVTGSSGSGVAPKATTHHPFRHGNLWAYGLGGHRHEAELLQSLEALDLAPEICFVPHSGPFVRGIHLTAMLPLAETVSAEEATAAYRAAFEGEAFVRLLDGEAPDLRRVVGSNSIAIAPFVRGRTLVVLAVLDNLIKGGAGQALQCLNLMLGTDESHGLPRLGLGVV